MIITQTPLRISFLGGGTDFREYFLKEDGWVLSSAIDKYIFVTIKERFDDKIHVGWTRTERVDHVHELQHELVRECLRKTGIERGIEISTMGDIPADGSGLGSSSTVTVGLLNAMYTYMGTPKEQETLAREACEIEIDILGNPIGIQDQYIAAYGGLRFIHFGRDGQIRVESVKIEREQLRRFNQNLMLFYTNITRKAGSILDEQVQRIDDTYGILYELKKLALDARGALESGEFDDLGQLMHAGWALKRQLASRISNSNIDDLYDAALKAGAYGGKIAGAGGGGFLLLYCPRAHQDSVRKTLHGLSELSFHLESDGSKVIFNYRR